MTAKRHVEDSSTTHQASSSESAHTETDEQEMLEVDGTLTDTDDHEMTEVNDISATVAETDNQEMLDVDGIPGPRTWARLQQVMGVSANDVKDESSPMIEAFQRWLTNNIAPGSIADLGCSGDVWGALDVDGCNGPKTWKAFRYFAYSVVPELVAMHHGSHDWSFVEDVSDSTTISVLQEMLNRSHSGSGKLL